MKKIIGAIIGIVLSFFLSITIVFAFIRLIFDDTSSVQTSQYARRNYVDLYNVACEYDCMGDILEIFMSIMIEESNDNQTTADRLGSGYNGAIVKDGYRHAISRFKTLYDYAQSLGVTDLYHVVQAYHFQYYKEHQVMAVDESFCKDYLTWLVNKYSPNIRYSQTVASSYRAYASWQVYWKRRQMLIDAYKSTHWIFVEVPPNPAYYIDVNGNTVYYDWYSEDDLNNDAAAYADSVWSYGDVYYGRKDYALSVMSRTRYDYVYEVDIDLPTLGTVDSGDIVTLANAYLGRPYVSPGSSPPTDFDCSSFTRYIYGQCGKTINAQAYTQYNQASKFYDVSLAQPGDLVFFQDTRTDGELRIADDGKNITHVGIYIGNNQFIHASSGKGKVVKSSLSNSFYTTHFAAFGRF